MKKRIDWYLHPPPDLKYQITHRLEQAVARTSLQKVELFFRADDIGVPGNQFFRLLALCMDYEMPMAMAMVPAWTTTKRWETIQREAHRKAGLWCWHQHGWRHANHEPLGKKQEFGPSRPAEHIGNDLERGRLKLQGILGQDFFPIFTPPWNRCDERTLAYLKQHKYFAVSRSAGSRPESPSGLPDLYINVDLHTRKESDPAQAWANLLDEFSKAFASGYCGVMLHHQRMTPAAFSFLEILFSFVVHSNHIRLTHPAQMAAS